MPTLAKELGCGVTSIYWYFRSKDDLVVALAERVEKRMYARLPRSATGPGTTRSSHTSSGSGS
jgi:AcrR family transcriptional regulator